MTYETLAATMEALSQPGKGILAADESLGTIGKRFDAIGIDNTETNRRDYRLLLATAPALERHVHGVILFEETFDQTNADGKTIANIFADKGILPGIKVDKGLIPLVNTEHEKVTQGMDGLGERLQTFKEKGAKFAKWRNVYSIGEYAPSMAGLRVGADLLACYAAMCQAAGLIPIVEPEILMEGNHSIEACADVSAMVLHEVFSALYLHQVELELMILKPSMVTAGQQCTPFSSPEEVAEYTIDVFRRHVPAAVPSIHFLSGGQTATQSTINLQAINSIGEQPWQLSFSFGRALQDDCLKTWAGKASQVQAAQAILVKRAELNGLASLGEYEVNLEGR